MSIKRVKKIIIPVFGITLFILIWQSIAWLNLWDENLFPSPIAASLAIGELFSEGLLWEHIGISLYRFFSGYLLAVGIALPLGLLLGWYTIVQKAVYPIIQVLRPVSPIAWFPFVVLWFGIGNAPAIAIIFIAAFFPILLSGISSMSKIDSIYLKVSDNFGLTRLQFFYKIAIPLAFPYITVGLHIALGTAWIFLVAGEMVGAQSGLGYLIIDARNNIRNDMVMAGIILIGITGLLLDLLIGLFESYVYKRWGIEKNAL